MSKLFGIDVKDWLASRSMEVREEGDEIHYIHSGEVRSFLLKRNEQQNLKTVPIHHQGLSQFYRKILGGSLFGGMLLLISPVLGGIHTSAGFKIPDIDTAKRVAADYGLVIPPSEDVFLISSAWMFFYTPASEVSRMLRCYDRDFDAVYEDRSFEKVLDEAFNMTVR